MCEAMQLFIQSRAFVVRDSERNSTKKIKRILFNVYFVRTVKGIDLDEWYSRLILHAVLTLFNKRISAD